MKPARDAFYILPPRREKNTTFRGAKVYNK